MIVLTSMSDFKHYSKDCRGLKNTGESLAVKVDHCGSYNWSSGTYTTTNVAIHGPGGPLVVGHQL